LCENASQSSVAFSAAVAPQLPGALAFARNHPRQLQQ
jgi:hypothetical protein